MLTLIRSFYWWRLIGIVVAILSGVAFWYWATTLFIVWMWR